MKDIVGTTQPVEFTWYVSDKGYLWDDLAVPAPYIGKTETKGPFLLSNPVSEGKLSYEPLSDYPALFREFSQLQMDQKSILEFANRYGELGENLPLISEHFSWVNEKGGPSTWKESAWRQSKYSALAWDGLTVPLNDKKALIIIGDSLSFWRREIAIMGFLVQIWDWLETPDRKSLKKVITWTDPWEVTYDWPILIGDSSGIIASRTIHPQILSRFRHPDVILPAKYLLLEKLNNKLETYPTIPQLLLDRTKETWALRTFYVPQTLIAALWFQFYLVISGQRKLRQCAVCGQWEDVTDKRSDWSKHPECGARERMRRHRENKGRRRVNYHGAKTR